MSGSVYHTPMQMSTPLVSVFLGLCCLLYTMYKVGEQMFEKIPCVKKWAPTPQRGIDALFAITTPGAPGQGGDRGAILPWRGDLGVVLLPRRSGDNGGTDAPTNNATGDCEPCPRRGRPALPGGEHSRAAANRRHRRRNRRPGAREAGRPPRPFICGDCPPQRRRG